MSNTTGQGYITSVGSTDEKRLFTIDDIISKISNNQKSARDYIDEIFIQLGLGKITTVRDKQFQGINHRHTAANLPFNMDHNGHTFFVRPNINLGRYNCLRVRQLAQLITNNAYSVQRWARMTLDPTLASESNASDISDIGEGLHSPLVDNENAFIPLLSNLLRTMTGVPSVVAGTYSSEKGLNKEVFGMIDDNVLNYEGYTVTCSFRNMNGNPLLILFYSWILAASMMYLGKITPRIRSIHQRRIEYTTRIYRLVLDYTQTYVTNIWAPTYCFPTTIETGSIFKYNVEDPFNRDNDNIDIQFQCYGSHFNDDLLFHQFNTTVCLANPAMEDNSRKRDMVKLDPTEMKLFNYYGYPRINPVTSELEWWVSKENYKGAANMAKDVPRIEQDGDSKPLAKRESHGENFDISDYLE